MSIAATLMASSVPSEAPAEAASMTLVCCFSTTIFTSPSVAGSSVSGYRILARYSPHGAAITLVVRIATGSAPSAM
jgi:hypothetical protein